MPWALDQLLLPLMDKYPNVYFTYDVIHMIITDHHRYGTERIWDDLGDDAVSEREFLAEVERVRIDTIVQWGLDDTADWFAQHPDRIVFGTDLFQWGWREAVSDKFFEIGREFIARLPEDIQEDYAYKNALRVFGRYLVPPHTGETPT